MADITLAIGADQLKHVNGCTTSAELWDKLKGLYESEGPTRKAMLLEDLIHHKMEEGEDMRDHVSRFADTVSKLEAMKIVIPQEMLVVILLSSVPSSYESFRIAIKSRKELPTLEELKIKLSDEYRVRQRSVACKNPEAMLVSKNRKDSTEKGKEKLNTMIKKTRSTCYCGKVGHFAKYCKSKQSETGGEPPKVGEVSMYVGIERDMKWCPDSGTSSHMCSENKKFLTLDRSKIGDLKMANYDSTPIEGKGTVEFLTKYKVKVKLADTLWVPKLRTNLLEDDRTWIRGHI